MSADGAPPAQPVDNSPGGQAPGRVQRAAKGAAGGSVAGPEGAAAGALAGLLSGGKKHSGGNKALVAELVVCMVLLILSPLIAKGGDITASKFMKKGSATLGVFIVLGIISTTGQTGKKVASGLGLLMTLTVLLNERSVFATITAAVTGNGVAIPAVHDPSTALTFGNGGPTTPGGNPESLQESLELGGGFAADAGTAVHNYIAGLFGAGPPPPSSGIPSVSTDQGESDYLNLFGAGD